MKTRFYQANILLIILLVLAVGCKKQEDVPKIISGQEVIGITEAVAVIHPLNNSNVSGIVHFQLLKDGVKVVADINGLDSLKHGIHIHEFGDLRLNDGSSAGGHFNPYGMPHGAPDSEKRHAGDLGNILALNDATAHFTWVDPHISFSGEASIIGKSVIIHSDEDDFISQPSGDAGQRIAGGVIGIANKDLPKLKIK